MTEETRTRRKPKWTDILLLLVVVVTAWAAIASQQASNDVEQNYLDDKVARCEAGVDSRNIQRETVQAIFVLAGTFSEPDPNEPPPDNIEVAQLNAYIDRVNTFRAEMYEKIKPSKECAQYVEDDNVEPPTPDMPQVTLKE